MITAESPTLTITEAAQRLNLSPKTVRQRVKRGELRAHLVEGLHGPEYRVPAEALESIPGWDGFSPGQGTVS
jgi:excisionase family DNA binding protein